MKCIINYRFFVSFSKFKKKIQNFNNSLTLTMRYTIIENTLNYILRISYEYYYYLTLGSNNYFSLKVQIARLKINFNID
jgi:hypothetical protein